jgi:hypothetical protein
MSSAGNKFVSSGRLPLFLPGLVQPFLAFLPLRRDAALDALPQVL